LENKMAVPRLQKIVINVGVGEAINDAKLLDTVTSNVAAITGQKPVQQKQKNRFQTLNLREGVPIGCKVTLRKKVMYEFLDR
jgi:large subunit ribosomal protein L5